MQVVFLAAGKYRVDATAPIVVVKERDVAARKTFDLGAEAAVSLIRAGKARALEAGPAEPETEEVTEAQEAQDAGKGKKAAKGKKVEEPEAAPTNKDDDSQ